MDNGMTVLRLAQTRLYTLNLMRMPLFRGPVGHHLSDLLLHIDNCLQATVDRPYQYFEKFIKLVETGEIIYHEKYYWLYGLPPTFRRVSSIRSVPNSSDTILLRVMSTKAASDLFVSDFGVCFGLCEQGEVRYHLIFHRGWIVLGVKFWGTVLPDMVDEIIQKISAMVGEVETFLL